MPGISRNGQDVAGGVAIEGSSNVSVNSKGVVRLGDKVASHGLAPHSPTPRPQTRTSAARSSRPSRATSSSLAATSAESNR